MVPNHLVKYLQYIVNTGQQATAKEFDEDWAPIGSQLRSELIPKFVFEGSDGRLFLTKVGEAAVQKD